ncbi:MAG: HupE/UreJ family protein [Pseudomonadota bacterium]
MLFALLRSFVLACLVLMGAVVSGAAHEIVPSIVTIQTEGNRINLAIETNLEAQIAGIGPEHDDTDEAPQSDRYKALRALSAGGLKDAFYEIADEWVAGLGLKIDGTVPSLKIEQMAIPPVGDVDLARSSTIRLTGEVPPGARVLTWAYPRSRGSSVLRIERTAAEMEARFFNAGETSDDIALRAPDPRNWVEKAWDYVVVGFTHILPKGLDHILFVLGLFFLSMAWRPLLMQVTAFTIAHSVTLALGLYGVVQISPTIVEPLIALSIVYVAVENIFTRSLQVWRPVIVFLFGLLHGLGFAGILTEIGLPPSDFILGLVAFNVGVEFGQITVLIMAFALVGWMAAKPWYRARVAIPASLFIAAMGAYWFLERTVLA